MKLRDATTTKEFGETLENWGISPSEHRAFGGVDGDAHSPGSLHYQRWKKGNFPRDEQGNLALDVNDNDVRDDLLPFDNETEALHWLYDRVLTLIKRHPRTWGRWVDEMFFDGKGYRIETGPQVNVPISGHSGHWHIGFTQFDRPGG